MSEPHDPAMAHLVRCETKSFGLFDVGEGWFAPGFAFPTHRHDQAQFIVVLKGAMDLTIGARHYECVPAMAFTEPPGDLHRNRIGNEGTHVLILTPHAQQTELFRPCRPVFDEPLHIQHGGIRSLAWRLLYELRTSDAASELAVQGLGLEMLAAAARVRSTSHAQPPPWLVQAEELLRSRFRDSLTVEQVAAAVDIHPVHLARTFRTYHHDSIGAFVRRLRLDWAITRLATSDDALATIAHQAGFADQSHFSRAFKTYTGLTPGRYRRTVTGN